ncbi:MAG: ATP-dependent metallopeptidase FtsH/Yme1/Tma family protein, partial [Oscillospiraceae bacterium]|nr:ATP-dependent metallopeptidase FtsH/Yme1/Tma family protein [Oscillospiraceae bacterium]
MDPNNNNENKNGRGGRNLRGIATLVVWAIVLTVVFNYISAYTSNASNRSTSHEIQYSELLQLVRSGKVDHVVFRDGTIYAVPVDGYVYTDEEGKEFTNSEKTELILYTVQLNDPDLLALLDENGVDFTEPYQARMSPVLEFMIAYIVPILLMVGAMVLLMRFISKSGGGLGGIGSVGKANAKVYMEKSTGVTFKDVAGQDEAKESLVEIIDVLHNPGKYTAIGAKLPKGALLVGSPGTGKTL